MVRAKNYENASKSVKVIYLYFARKAAQMTKQ